MNKVLLDKSKENIQAADILINAHGCHSASIHCSYYSSFQLTLHILKNQLGLSDKDLDMEVAFAGGKGTDSHNKTINALFSKMHRKNEILNAVDYKRAMGELKNTRWRADYTNTAINDSASRDAYQKALEINKIIEKVYPIS